MIILPAIDLYEKKAVRLFKGRYDQMTVYSDNPIEIARDFESCGAAYVHVVDLEGAKDGTTPNLEIVKQIARETGLKVEIGGGIRDMKTVEKYISAGVNRIIIGTAAVTDEAFLCRAASEYGNKIAVGADVRDGFIAIKGWLEKSEYSLENFLDYIQQKGITTVICTDISKDGAMKGTNLELYRKLSERYSLNIIASGGVSSVNDIKQLRKMNLYGAIIGKAYYTDAVNLKEAIEVAK
ncbi:MAG: 1-(5-phosphoribosyl)-5-[(5-phosphoribosylamino)methylideneamino]imidazole-4-carboxamide isomerase [Clostridia bacterium]|nr:1-(5-phosphoribosyl)-5-[(5-phosphoribosylamino)methylideneamino]imidazole-4-carboxamide isomerase [Clostridia bacterium]